MFLFAILYSQGGMHCLRANVLGRFPESGERTCTYYCARFVLMFTTCEMMSKAKSNLQNSRLKLLNFGCIWSLILARTFPFWTRFSLEIGKSNRKLMYNGVGFMIFRFTHKLEICHGLCPAFNTLRLDLASWLSWRTMAHINMYGINI